MERLVEQRHPPLSVAMSATRAIRTTAMTIGHHGSQRPRHQMTNWRSPADRLQPRSLGSVMSMSRSLQLHPSDWVAYQDDSGQLCMGTVLTTVIADWYAIELDDPADDVTPADPDALPQYLQRGLDQLAVPACPGSCPRIDAGRRPVCAHAPRESLVFLGR